MLADRFAQGIDGSPRPQGGPLLPARWFYGWTVVGAVFVLTFVGHGSAYTLAAFFPSLQHEFGAARGSVSLLFSLSGFLYFSLGAVTGPLSDRIGPRRLAIAGMMSLALGLALASQAQTLWQICLAYGLGVGLGIGLTYVPAVGAVQKWFIRQRGFATGLAVSGIGVGTLVMPLAAGALIELTGWRQAYLLLAVLPATIGVAAAYFLVDSPASHGLQPDGQGPDAANAGLVTTVAEGPTIAEALSSLPFWLIYAASFLTGLGLFTPVVHLAAYAQDHNLSERTGLWLVGLIGVGSIVGRLTTGRIADRLGRGRSLTAIYGAMAIVLMGWYISTAAWSLAAFALLFGLCWGGYVALFPAISADYFGGRNGSGIFGLLITNLAFATLIGPALAGFSFDMTGSYALPIIGSAIANVAAVGCMMLLEHPSAWRTRTIRSIKN